MKRLLARLTGRSANPPPALEDGFAALAAGDANAARRISASLLAAGMSARSAFLESFIALDARDQTGRVAHLQMACTRDPQEPAYAIELSKALADSGDHAAAVTRLAPILERPGHPASADAVLHFMLAGWLHALGALEPARESLQQALRLDPGFSEAAGNLSEMLYQSGAVDASREVLRAAAFAPGRPAPNAALLIRRALYLPAAYSSTAQMQDVRGQFGADLETVESAGDFRLTAPDLEIGRTAFFLAYQGRNDRDDLARLGRIVRRGYTAARSLVGDRQSARAESRTWRRRIGFASPYFYRHSVGRAFLGFVEGLDRRRFDVSLFVAPGAAATPRDTFSTRFEAIADTFVRLPSGLEAAARVIAAADLDILVYPDLGMDPFTYFLAFWRLAPLQCVCAGHPSTTGIDTIDWFLSDASAEPDGADDHYSEKLLRIDDFFLPIHDRPVVVPGAATAQATRRYVCGQTIVKLHPDFDAMLAGILDEDPAAEVLLYADGAERVTRVVAQRMAARLGSAMDRVRIVPRQGYEEYLATLGTAAVVLDTPHFSGGNTTLEALSLNLPIVTLPGAFLRGRFAFARLEALGLSQCIATDGEDYVTKAVAVARTPRLRASIVERLVERVGAATSPRGPVPAFAAALDRLPGTPP